MSFYFLGVNMRIIFLSILVLLQIIFLTQAEARGGRGGGRAFSSHSYSSSSHHYSSKSKLSHGRSSYGGSSSSSSSNSSSECPCSGSNNCVGPRGGTYCITPSGNKKYR